MAEYCYHSLALQIFQIWPSSDFKTASQWIACVKPIMNSRINKLIYLSNTTGGNLLYYNNNLTFLMIHVVLYYIISISIMYVYHFLYKVWKLLLFTSNPVYFSLYKCLCPLCFFNLLFIPSILKTIQRKRAIITKVVHNIQIKWERQDAWIYTCSQIQIRQEAHLVDIR